MESWTRGCIQQESMSPGLHTKFACYRKKSLWQRHDPQLGEKTVKRGWLASTLCLSTTKDSPLHSINMLCIHKITRYAETTRYMNEHVIKTNAITFSSRRKPRGFVPKVQTT